MCSSEHLSEAFEAAGDPASALVDYKKFQSLFRSIGSESAQRSARVAAIRLGTRAAREHGLQQQDRADRLQALDERLSREADDLVQLSLEDPLTGLANRRSMDRLFATTPRAFGVLVIDVDHFKRINDEWSHATGDEVLRRLAKILKDCCRASDAAVRYGGEEFALLLRESEEAGALGLGERVRRSVDHFAWNAVAPGLRVTVSVGVASAFEAETAVEVLAMADRRLYVAKATGRNRVVGRSGDPG